jgi:hypothetical protein
MTLTYVTAALVVVLVVDTWLLCRVAARIGVLGRLEERVSTLTHTIALLTDTTETCFNVVASQLEPGATSRAPKPRATRQRRVVGAASIGRSVSQIAADEEVAESEVALRLALSRRAAAWEELENGTMRS